MKTAWFYYTILWKKQLIYASLVNLCAWRILVYAVCILIIHPNPSIMEEQPQNEAITKKERREQRREEKRAVAQTTVRSRSARRIGIWTLTLLTVTGAAYGVYYLASRAPAVPEQENNTALSLDVSPQDWVRGNAKSPIALVEYGDFQCPACGQYHPLVKGLEAEFGERVAFVYRHFPLTRAHPNATAASRAAEAAGLQDKFWEMHDILFERQTEWSPKPNPTATFAAYAEELGLDSEQFKTDYNKNELEDKIDAHFQSGIASGVNATPTFFLNGEKLESPRSFDEFRHMLEQAIAIAGLSVEETTSSSTEMIVPANGSGAEETLTAPEKPINSEN
jgi:protein-disulfide isomerase